MDALHCFLIKLSHKNPDNNISSLYLCVYNAVISPVVLQRINKSIPGENMNVNRDALSLKSVIC